jgi:glycine/D-amino acid oxidase-like deaminating enzyme
VRSIERAGGKVSAVVTDHGTVKTSLVVCATGAWTSWFCRDLGISVPQLRVKGTVARTAPTEQILEGQAWCPTVAIRRRADGGYTVAHGSAFHHYIGADSFRFATKFIPALKQEQGAIRLRLGTDPIFGPQPDARVLDEMRAALRTWFPEIAAAPFVETWGGTIETSPDVLPMIAPCEALTGFLVATGFSAPGFGIGPGAGALVARMVTGGARAAALAPFRLTRFFDGSPIVPGPTI